jgi:hypothetical protein
VLYTKKMSAESKKRVSENDSTLQADGSEKSQIAREIEDLQSTVMRFARERERLPQPLFWSLFNARLRDIKKNKELERLLRETLG